MTEIDDKGPRLSPELWERLGDEYELPACPECGAAPTACCSYPDPDHTGRGIEVGLYVHKVRLPD